VVKLAFFLAGLYTATLIFFSLYKITPEITMGDLSVGDKLLHASAYFVLFLVWKFSFFLKAKNNYTYKATILKISVLCIAFGMLIEVLQGTLTSYRQPDWLDVIANSTGVLIASILFLTLERPLKKVKN
jgi:VanZ family protein|tara:strand:- start:665 stop:1051 length:387 start_codon:yes stop_codon:yes gene_type:complete